ncbi:hypothetical protein [Pengzhenrongella sp.]|jgi:ABC-type glycerol-3-phosphate transport system substrate-binding protein|uniref:hypothetical protein n=1 Tax=Pengzhenrongella sp. TaxID=2888820 RepID=UPI002F94D24C
MLGSSHIAAHRPPLHRRLRHPTARLRSLALSLLLLTVAVLAGCDTPREAAPETTRLTMWAHGGQPTEEAALRTLVAGFRTAHPHITVRLTVAAHQDDYNDKLQTGIASG